jgi:hypothetical protein
MLQLQSSILVRFHFMLLGPNKEEFCYGVYNQYESFICLDLMIKNRDVPIERYFK